MVARAAGALALLGLSACGAGTQHTTPVTPAGAPTPRTITDLAALSRAPSAAEAGGASALPAPEAGSAPQASKESSAASAELRRLFLEGPENREFAGTAARPGEETLLNGKAARFAEFSNTLMHQVFVAAQTLERGEFSTTVLPEKLKPVILTGTITKEGKLRELVVEQHSGSAKVDKLVIDACKRGLWTHNPPPQALTPDGDYKVRVEGRLQNFNSSDQIHWNYETHIGLALL